MCKQVHSMIGKAIVLAVALCFLGAALCFADTLRSTTWRPATRIELAYDGSHCDH
jgi:hypothetical protein